MTYLEAFNIDDGVRWRELINALHVRDRVIQKKEQAEWAQSDLYPHPLKVMEKKGKPVREYVRSIIKFIKSSLP